MKMSDLQNLDPSNIGGWPTAAKVVLLVLICAAVLGAGYWFDTQHQVVALDGVKNEEQQLKNQFETKQAKAANLQPLTQQLAEMKESFGALLRLLPNRTEIEGLLVDISQSGLASGLEFELFKPEPEKPEEFYAIQPIKIRVTGGYHEFGEFISAVAALPRIVTQHDIAIRPVAGDLTQEELVMELTAKTYRYLEEDEATDAAN
ncbi:MAG: type 4a pilus biogenesis protein PilO [Gammaproteobacteria bacterium]|nr:type 4a pilus biogenesis protein PilO [Gammaproteobacteria bacterium]